MIKKFNHKWIKRFPVSIFALSIVSFLMNMSTSIVSSTATNFTKDILKNNLSFLVIIKSLSDGFSYFIKVFIGVCSDMSKKRKIFLNIGYGGIIFIKPLFFISTLKIFSLNTNIFIYAISQIIDRLLNAIRDIPRDSLIADATSKEIRSQSFGLRKFFASLGSQFGGCISFICAYFFLNKNLYQILYIIAIIPAIFSIFILLKYVKEPISENINNKENWFSIKKILKEKINLKKYFFFLFIIFILSLGKFNEVCIFSMVSDLGYSNLIIIFLFMFFYTISALSSYLLSLSKKENNISFFFISIFSLIITNLLMSNYSNLFSFLLANFFFGIYGGITESIIFGNISLIFPEKNMRATLFGITNLCIGLSICLSGIIISYLRTFITMKNIYLYGSFPPILALILFLFFFFHKKYS